MNFPPVARILSIGNELLDNGTVNSNGSFLSSSLKTMGVRVKKLLSVGDHDPDIVEEITAHFLANENILILTGGLGPTQDDLTVTSVARALGVQEVIDSDHLAYLEAIRQDRNLSERFLKQAVAPQTFTVEKSPYGSAPFLYRIGKTTNREPQLLVLLPGVPYECLSLFQDKVVPLIQKVFPGLSRQGHFQELKIISVPESMVEESLENIRGKLKTSDDKRFQVAFLPSLGELLIRLRIEGEDASVLKKISHKLRASFPDHQSYAAPLDTPILSVLERLHRFFSSKKWRVGFAESCTGGLLTSGFVAWPGSSAYLDSGVVTYSNEAKTALCGVPPQILKKYGAVSPQTAEKMAVGLARKRDLHLTVSITGIAGPGGGSQSNSGKNEGKPVGLVYIAVYHKPPGLPPTLITRKFHFAGSAIKRGKAFQKQVRNRIRERAIKNALFMMMEVCFPSKQSAEK